MLAWSCSVSDAPLYGCIEAGGTKFVVGVARDERSILRTLRIPTTMPVDTLDAAISFLNRAQSELGSFASCGVASFGPLSLNRTDADWGHILNTPKPGWNDTDLVGTLNRGLGCPIGFDTDVNAAILAESRWGAASDAEVAVYVTVGTGIGGGVLVRGLPTHGLRHPEMGHMLPRRHPQDGDFAGVCPFHGDCLEGLASGPAVMARWGSSLSDLPSDHLAHEVIAYYVAQLLVAQMALLSPCRIVLGGGVLDTPGLLDRVRTITGQLAAGYFGAEDYASLIVAPGLGSRAGLLGALALAQGALQ
jgi:fructokinase